VLVRCLAQQALLFHPTRPERFVCGDTPCPGGASALHTDSLRWWLYRAFPQPRGVSSLKGGRKLEGWGNGSLCRRELRRPLTLTPSAAPRAGERIGTPIPSFRPFAPAQHKLRPESAHVRTSSQCRFCAFRLKGESRELPIQLPHSLFTQATLASRVGPALEVGAPG
jgi:hypothetical protein